jgi:hypothetical protein
MIINKIFYYCLLGVSWISVVIAQFEETQQTETKQEIRGTNYISPEFEQEIGDARDLEDFFNIDTRKLDSYFETKVEHITKLLRQLLRKLLASDNVDSVRDPATELRRFEIVFDRIKYSNLHILNDIRESSETRDGDKWHLLDTFPKNFSTGQYWLSNHNVVFTILTVINNNVAELIGSQDTSNSSARLQKYRKMLDKLHNILVPVLKTKDPGNLNLIFKPVDKNIDTVSIKQNRVDIYADKRFRSDVIEVIWRTVWLVSIYGLPGYSPSDALAELLNANPNVLSCLGMPLGAYNKWGNRSILEPVLHHIPGYLQNVKSVAAEGDEREWLEKLSKWATKLVDMGGRGEGVDQDIWELERQTYENGDWAQAFSMVDADKLDTYFQQRINNLKEIFELNKDSSEAVDILNKLRDLVYRFKYSNLCILNDMRNSFKAKNIDRPKTDLLDIDQLLENYPTLLPKEYSAVSTLEYSTGDSTESSTGDSLEYMEDVLGWCFIMVTVQYAINDNTAKVIGSQAISNSSHRLQRYQTMLGQLHASIAPVLKVRNIGPGNNYEEAKTSPELNLIIRGNTVKKRFRLVDRYIQKYLPYANPNFFHEDHDLIDEYIAVMENIYADVCFGTVVGSIIFETLLRVSIYGCQGQKPSQAMTHLLNSVPKVLHYLESGQPKTNDKVVLQPTLHGLDDYLQRIIGGGVTRDWFTKISEWARKLRVIEDLANNLDWDVSDSDGVN